MASMLTLRVTMVLLVMMTELYAKETPQDFLSKYNKYNTVCLGMGYKTTGNGGDHGIIAFHARISSDLQNLGNYAAVVFGKVTLNSGSAYDGKTGIFTAPTDGIYSFTWTILTRGGTYFHTEIVINGNAVAYNFANFVSNGTHHESSTTTAVIRMKKKDRVWIRTCGRNGKFAAAIWSSFSGFQL